LMERSVVAWRREANAPRALDAFNNDGQEVLCELIAGSEWRTLEQAIASLTAFAHPDAVAAIGHRAVFMAVRGKRKTILESGYLGDDNDAPDVAFRIVTGFNRGDHLQCNHIYAAAQDPEAYTDIRNICFTPSFLAKLTDCQKGTVPSDHPSQVLRYRAWELHGYAGTNGIPPKKPERYDDIVWAKPVGEGLTRASVEAAMRAFLANKRKKSLTVSVALLGWTFSDYQPDPKVACDPSGVNFAKGGISPAEYSGA
jgi:hypothetical protein